MFHANNVIQPCILCGQPVVTKKSCFCPNCAIFKDKPALEAAVFDDVDKLHTQFTEGPECEVVFLDENEDEGCKISYDLEENV